MKNIRSASIRLAALSIISISLCFLFISCENVETEKSGVGAIFSYDSHALSITDMSEDYNNMWKIIENNYPYMQVAERTTKKDFEEVKAAYHKKIKEVKNDKGFGELINACLNEFEGCGHMRMLNSDVEFAGYLDGYKEAGKTSAHCNVIYNTLNNDTSRTYYNYKQNANLNTGENKNENSINSVNFSTEVYDDINTAYIKIPGFDHNNIKASVPALVKFFQSISDFKNCIIDIRGNGGGSDAFWIQGIVEPNLKNELISTYCMLAKGPESEEYLKNDFQLFPIGELDVSTMPELKAEDLEEMDYYCRITRGWNMSSDPAFKGDFYILTDNKNYSSAESFVVFCKSTGFATLVGEKTGGDGMGIDPMVSTLPKSGICFRFSVLYGLNPDGGSNEECGTEPNISCYGEDALNVCLKYIREKN